MFFGFAQYQAALIVLLAAPFAIVCSNPASGLYAVEVAAIAVWLAALAGLCRRSRQLQRLNQSWRWDRSSIRVPR